MHFVKREESKYAGWFIVPLVFEKQSSKIYHSANDRWITVKDILKFGREQFELD